MPRLRRPTGPRDRSAGPWGWGPHGRHPYPRSRCPGIRAGTSPRPTSGPGALRPEIRAASRRLAVRFSCLGRVILIEKRPARAGRPAAYGSHWMKKALVCGAGGFIAGHLVKRLKREGYWVRGVDIKQHEFSPICRRRLSGARPARRAGTAAPPCASKTARSRRSTTSQPTWAAWASSTAPSARSCATAPCST